MYSKKLIEIASKYIDIIRKIEKTSNKDILIKLEAERVRLHNILLDISTQEGIVYNNRDEVTDLAFKIVRGKK